jgi:tetratricopeptide (TPR) repeat protein
MGDYKDALICFEKAATIDPNYLGSWNDRGLMLFKLGRFEEALTCYDQALAIDPDNAMTLVNKGADLVSPRPKF